MKLYSDVYTALQGAGAVSRLAKRYLVEIHSTKAKTSRFAVVSDVAIIPYKHWELLKVITPKG